MRAALLLQLTLLFAFPIWAQGENTAAVQTGGIAQECRAVEPSGAKFCAGLTPAEEETTAVNCETYKQSTATYLASRGFTFERERGVFCKGGFDCFIFWSRPARGVNGKIITRKEVNDHYLNPRAAIGKGFGALGQGYWSYSSGKFGLRARLWLQPVDQACHVALKVEFVTSSSNFLVIIPYEPDVGYLTGNGQLEREFLDAFRMEWKRQAGAGR